MAHDREQDTLDHLARRLIRINRLERTAERVGRVLEWVVASAERAGRRLCRLSRTVSHPAEASTRMNWRRDGAKDFYWVASPAFRC